MMLWDIIRDFFVKYIFGGITSNGEGFGGMFGRLGYFNEAFFEISSVETYDTFVGLPNFYADITSAPLAEGPIYISLGDYLSTTATIITLVVLAIVVALGIRWLFRFLISRFTKWGL